MQNMSEENKKAMDKDEEERLQYNGHIKRKRTV
jgi:hypothetical protein